MGKGVVEFLKTSSLETYVLVFSIVVGTIFLIAAVITAWCYYFSAFICYASAVMVTKNKPKNSKIKPRF